MSVFIIGGCQRSGTTLLQTLICQHPEFNPLIKEAKYFRHLVNAYAFGKEAYDYETQYYFSSEQDYYEFNKDIIHRFIKQTKKLFPKSQHLVLREPHLTMLFPALFELLPDVKFITIVRHPCDVIASMIKVGEKLLKQNNTDPLTQLFNRRDMAELSQYYLSFYTPSIIEKNKLFKNSLIYLRYEDLVNNTDDILLELDTFSGIDLSKIDSQKTLNSGQVNYKNIDLYSSAWKSPLYEKKISKERINAYKGVLKEKEVLDIKHHCASFIESFHYS